MSCSDLTEEQLFASYPSNVWLSQLHFGGDEALKNSFELNCAFCHQQASPFMRNERTEEQWLSVMERMNTYGARLPAEDQQQAARLLRKEYRELREDPSVVQQPKAWEKHLSEIELTEWPIGDGFSQMHDFLIHPNGYVYVGDNLFDRLYEIDPKTGKYTVYKVPHDKNMELGGIMGNRFKVFPKMYNYLGVHSFAYSKKDGNIFITPSMQQALLEFDVTTKRFITHDMSEGYYPHTIRVDELDRPVARSRHDCGVASRPEQSRLQEARNPVREAVGRVKGSDDEPRAHDQRAVAEHGADFLFAARLQRAVVRLAEAHAARQRLDGIAVRVARGQPVDRTLSEVAARLEASLALTRCSTG